MVSGESNCGEEEASFYDRYLTTLIASWREGFADVSLPFVVVQIADFDGRDFPAWHEIQARQQLVCETVPHCRLAVSRDISETDNIHPPTKPLLSLRIAELLSELKSRKNTG